MTTRLRVLRLVERAHASLVRRDDANDTPAPIPELARGLTRRDALALGASALAAALLAACDSQGPDGSARLLRFAER